LSQVIGRVVTGTYETVRGPDVLHRVAVAREWLLDGRLVELELPRNLTCAACEGGGCDRCGRSGAIALRERGEPVASVQLTLPRRTSAELTEQPSFVVRVPGHGGRDSIVSVEARGLLLLKVVVSKKSDPGIHLVGDDEPAPAESVAKISRRPARAAEVPAASAPRISAVTLVAVVVVFAWIAALVVLGIKR
jgi:hypothetical protein